MNTLQADINTNEADESGAFYGVTSQYEGNENVPINCSTKVCSFGKQVVEKVEVRNHFRCIAITSFDQSLGVTSIREVHYFIKSIVT